MIGPRVKLFSIFGGLVALSVATIGLLLTIVIGLVLVFGLASLLIYHQEHVLYIPVIMGYRTVADNPEGFRSPAEWGVEHEDFFVETKDKQSIHCWRIKGLNPVVGTVIFCHENAGNIGLRVNNLVAVSRHLGVDVVAFDYRGYGSSSGKPSEEGLMLDTQAVYDHVLKEFKPKNLFLYGRSLGGAVALQFASRLGKSDLKGVIAENTFTSISAMVGSVFPLLNLGFVKKYFLRLRWETDRVIESIKVPVLLISGLKDEIVPASHMADLYRICKEHKLDAQMVTFAEGKHNDTWVVGGQEYWLKQRDFILAKVAITK
jgi:pimeloyl-ACP methyl ester carboxylesterase